MLFGHLKGLLSNADPGFESFAMMGPDMESLAPGLSATFYPARFGTV